MITEDYVNFETAKLLKENGFEGENRDWYNMEGFIEEVGVDDGIDPTAHEDIFNNIIPAPTLQMAMKWLREVHNLFIEPTAGENDGKFWYDFDVIPVNGRNIKWDHYENIPTEEYSSPEQACEAAIKCCLENFI